MRIAALTLAALAAAKIGTIDYLHHTATRDAIVTAYGSQAVSACREASRSENPKPAALWGAAQAVRVEVGDRQTEASLWQIDSQNWQARYRRTYIVLDADGARCRFDLQAGTAHVSGQ